MMRDGIAPHLRRLGFKGSGQAYALPSDTCWALLGFQKWRYSDSKDLKFTVNLSVVSKAAWERARSEHSWLPARPAPNAQYAADTPMWNQRIGRLLPGDEDRWWEMSAASSAVRLVDEVVKAIRDFALPTLLEQIEAATPAHPTPD